jgi:hypothetical protein
MCIEEDPIRFRGRCNLYDPDEDIVYSLKARNGWYKFSPPIERHVDQLHIYMQGLNAERGKLVYVSKNDIEDIREWPTPSADPPSIVFDESRYDGLVAKAKRIRDAVWTNRIAATTDEIPFPKCDCYFCGEESLAFPDTPVSESASLPATSATDTSGASSGEDNETGRIPASTTPATDAMTSTSTDVSNEVSPATGVNREKMFVVTDSDDFSVVETDCGHVPRDLRDLKVWVVWDAREKVALAPWQTGTMYPCEWAVSKNIDPRREFEKARMVAELPVQEIHRTWPFPDGDDLPERVSPAVLLPHESPDPPISFVDFDDVRDPHTGAVPVEVVELIDALGGYVELSQSGTGLHAYVRGSLPRGVNTFAAPLKERGTIETYDHSRFTGGTWRHVEGTPLDVVPEAGDVLATLVSQYGEGVHPSSALMDS